MRAREQKVSGQTSFESPIHSHVSLSSLKCCAPRQTFPHCKVKSNWLFWKRTREGRMELERMMNEDWHKIRRDMETGKRDGQVGHSDRTLD